jgi:uncharacterized membrane protein
MSDSGVHQLTTEAGGAVDAKADDGGADDGERTPGPHGQDQGGPPLAVAEVPWSRRGLALAMSRTAGVARGRAPAWLRHVPVVALVALYAIHFASITVAMLHAYEQPAFDMSIPDQGIWLLSRFHDPFLTVAGRNLFGDHPSFVYLLLVPVFWVYPHTAALLVVQAMLMASAAVPIYLLARHLLHNSFLATCLAAAYLLNPALQQTNLEQFHVEAFETPLLALGIYAAVRWRPALFIICAVLILMCKEDAALYTVPLAAWVLWRRDRNVGTVVICASALMAAFDNLLLVPALIGYASAHGGRLPFGGLAGTLRAIVRTPGQFWGYITSDGRPWYLWQMGLSGGLVLLVAPEIAAICVLQLGVNVVSSFGYQHQILYHYSMPLVPILVCGTVYAVSRLRTARHQQAATVVVLLCALWSCVLWGAAPFSDVKPIIPGAGTPVFVSDRQLLSSIPPNASVSAVEEFVPALDHRTSIYMWPNPFHQAYYGNPKYDGTDWPFSSTVQYLVLPACIACNQGTSPWVPTFDKVAAQFRVVAENGNYVVYERKRT